MVKKGPFTVEIIDADTKQAFKEHNGPNDGKTYAEVEPDAEYFIRIKSECPNGALMAKYNVDGESLGFYSMLCYGQEDMTGLYSVANGKETTKALRFQKASVMDLAADGDGKPWTGSVEISFHHAVEDGHYILEDLESPWGGGKVGTLLGGQAKKGVKSTAGSTLGTVNAKRRKIVHYRATAHVDTIELHYCTALGLIFAGVLPRPPRWDLHRMQFPRTQADDEENGKTASAPSPVSVATTSVHVEERRYEMISLI